MIVENVYVGDPRVINEAQTLKDKFGVTVLALRLKGNKLVDNIDGIRIIGIPAIPNVIPGKSIYILQYLYFTLCASLTFLISYPFLRYKVIHAHNPPDTLFIVGVLGKLFGVKFVYDHHDLSPELYISRFSNPEDIFYKILTKLESISCRLADIVITTNKSYLKLITKRHNLKKDKLFVVRNDPIIEDFKSASLTAPSTTIDQDKHLLLFVGAINPQDGLDILMEVIRILVYDFNRTDFICNIIGTGDSLNSVKKQALNLKIGDFVDFKGFTSDRKFIADYLSNSSVGLEPAPKNPVNNYSTFIKIMEYMVAGIPIVAFDLLESKFSAGDSAIFIEPGDIYGFADAIDRLLKDKRLCEVLGAKGRKRIQNNLNWSNSKSILLEAYSSIFPDMK